MRGPLQTSPQNSFHRTTKRFHQSPQAFLQDLCGGSGLRAPLRGYSATAVGSLGDVDIKKRVGNIHLLTRFETTELAS